MWKIYKNDTFLLFLCVIIVMFCVYNMLKSVESLISIEKARHKGDNPKVCIKYYCFDFDSDRSTVQNYHFRCNGFLIIDFAMLILISEIRMFSIIEET